MRRAGAELVVISPNAFQEHRKYALDLFGEELPFLYVPDPRLEIARSYCLLRKEEHDHGGFYCVAFWLVNQAGVIIHRSLPWKATTRVEEYQRPFALIGSEPGEWVATCGLHSSDGSRAAW